MRNDINEASFVAVEKSTRRQMLRRRLKTLVIFLYALVSETSYKVTKAFGEFDDVTDHRRASAIAQYAL